MHSAFFDECRRVFGWEDISDSELESLVDRLTSEPKVRESLEWLGSYLPEVRNRVAGYWEKPGGEAPDVEYIAFIGPASHDGHALLLGESPVVFFDLTLWSRHFATDGFLPVVCQSPSPRSSKASILAGSKCIAPKASITSPFGNSYSRAFSNPFVNHSLWVKPSISGLVGKRSSNKPPFSQRQRGPSPSGFCSNPWSPSPSSILAYSAYPETSITRSTSFVVRTITLLSVRCRETVAPPTKTNFSRAVEVNQLLVRVAHNDDWSFQVLAQQFNRNLSLAGSSQANGVAEGQ